MLKKSSEKSACSVAWRHVDRHGSTALHQALQYLCTDEVMRSNFLAPSTKRPTFMYRLQENLIKVTVCFVLYAGYLI